MKLLAVTTLLILMSPALYSQDLTGQWSGTLNVQGTQLRLIFHVLKTDTLFKATMDSPDQKANGSPVTTVNFNYPNLKFKISNLGAVYEGTMSGNRIAGKWMQSGQTFLLDLSKTEPTSKVDNPL